MSIAGINRNVGLVAMVGALLCVGLVVAIAPVAAIAVCVVVGLVVVAMYGTEAFLCLTILVLPVIPPGLYLFGSSAIYPQRLLVGALVGMVVLHPRLWAEHGSRLGPLTVPIRLFMAFLSVGLLSAVLSPLPSSALLGVAFYGLQLGGVLIAACMIVRAEHLERYFTAFSLAVIAVALLAVAQYFFPESALSHILGPVFTHEALGENGVRALPIRVSGPLAQPVELGGFAVFSLPFALRAATCPGYRCATLGKTAVLMALVSLMLSQSRMAMISVPVLLLIWFVASDRRRGAVAVVAISIAVLVGIFGISTLSTQRSILATTIAYRGEQSAETPRMQSIVGRTSLYQAGWRAIQTRPLLGFGMRLPTQQAQSEIFRRFGQTYAFESYWIVLPLEVGVLGVAVFAAFIASLLLAVHRYCPRATDRATVYALFAGGTVLAIGSNPLDISVTYLWLMLGVLLGASLLARTENSG